MFAKGAHYAISSLSSTYDVVSLDWTMDPKEARVKVSGEASLQGNLDPCALYASEVNFMLVWSATCRYLWASVPTGRP